MANETMIPPKEFDRYNNQRNDYANGEELMVTITLAEYRELVASKATIDDERRKMSNERLDKNKEIEELKKQIAALKSAFSSVTKQEE